MSKPTNKDIACVAIDLIKKSNKSVVAKSLASYLISERRSHDLDRIMREINKQLSNQTNKTEIDLISAYPVNEDIKNKIKKLLKVESAIFNQEIDKSVIGGVRAETSDVRLDLTVRNRLNRLKQYDRSKV
jgi:F0F1-type ATP synthase delta subunit